uniref:Galectin domain-containing protein n=1 Tax=Meloidogyne hapla TaxID=6305 RepID=A0A1I8C144_MELHA
MVTTHHVIPYLALDQCMLRPGQQHHGSFGFIFERPGTLLCDELLICYPGQLSGNNTLNGMITTIPYRLGKHAENPIKVLCAGKRAEFCKKGACSVGNPASHIWHGIKLSSVYEKHPEYNESIFITNIKLSFTDKEYLLNKTSLFAIELGNKDHFASHVREMHKKNSKFVPGKIINMTDGRKLSEKFFAHVDIGAYLHNYTGIWTIGLDLLPTSGQRNLHLFVYKGCACGMEAWFKKPTTPSSLIPKTNYISTPGEGKGKLFNDKDCTRRHTNSTKYNLGNITDQELLINFTLWSGREGKNGTIELFSGRRSILKLFANAKVISHTFNGKLIRKISQPVDLLTIGATMVLTIRVTKYYVWIGFSSDVWGPEFYVYRFWQEKWWEGKLFKGSNNKLKISGDFLTVTPVIIRKLNNDDKHNLAKTFRHEIKEKNYKLDTISTNVTFRLYLKTGARVTSFEIELWSDQLLAFYLHVDYWTTTPFTIITSYTFDKKSKLSNVTLFEIYKSHLIYYVINVSKIDNLTRFDIQINGRRFSNNTVISEIPIWMINRIKVSQTFLFPVVKLIKIHDNLELLDYQQNEIELKPPHKKHKIKLELQGNGTILCFEAKIPKAKDMIGRKEFQVYLFRDANDFNVKYGDTVLMLNFTFDPDEFTDLENISYILGTNSFLYLNSYIRSKGGWQDRKKHQNPIGTDVPILVHIIAEKKFFKISINEATDYIYYRHILPPWAVDNAMITGNIQNVSNFSEKCQEIAKNYKFPPNLFKLQRKLNEGDKIAIDGNIPKIFNGTIEIYFFQKALEWHNEGHFLLQL